MGTTENKILANIIKIRESQGISKRAMADILAINETSYGRIESGGIGLSFKHLAQIAGGLRMSIVDIITYPDKYAKVENGDVQSEPIEAVLQIKLQKSKKDQVLKLIFGDNDIEILNH